MFKRSLFFSCLLLLCQSCAEGKSQTVPITNSNGARCMAFRTKFGLITVDHFPTTEKLYRCKEYDVAILKVYPGSRFVIARGKPEYFIDRRGTRRNLVILFDEEKEWIVKTEFFPGESGLPVFNSNSQVVGLVLGNRVGRSIIGRVGKLNRAPIILEHDPKLKRDSDKSE